MIGFIAYQAFIALNLHFKKDNGYDFISFNGKTKVNEQSLEKNKHKWQFIGIEKRFGTDVLKFYYQVFKHYEFSWVMDKQLFRAVKSKVIQENMSRMDSFLENDFKRDCQWLANQLESTGLERTELFQTGNLYPRIYEYYVNGDIQLETLLLIDQFILSVLNRSDSKDVLHWPSEIDYLSNIAILMPLFFDEKEVKVVFSQHFL